MNTTGLLDSDEAAARTEPGSTGRYRLGKNALDRGVDPTQPCSICGEPFAGFDLHDDHVVPIGARTANDGLVLVRSTEGEFTACLLSETTDDAEVFRPVPCAALTHAHCNMSKGATRDIGLWRHHSQPALVVAVNDSDERVALPPVMVLDPSPEWDWTDTQREARDRGVEALRRRGDSGARELKTVAELRAVALALERENRRAAVEVEADKLIAAAKAELDTVRDFQAVNATVDDITRQREAAKVVWEATLLSLPEPSPPGSFYDVTLDGYAPGYFDGCFEHDVACAALRRCDETMEHALNRAAELRRDAANATKHADVGQGTEPQPVETPHENQAQPVASPNPTHRSEPPVGQTEPTVPEVVAHPAQPRLGWAEPFTVAETRRLSKTRIGGAGYHRTGYGPDPATLGRRGIRRLTKQRLAAETEKYRLSPHDTYTTGLDQHQRDVCDCEEAAAVLTHSKRSYNARKIRRVANRFRRTKLGRDAPKVSKDAAVETVHQHQIR